ncbi:MAG: thioesterase family protein [Mycolicibacterium insubricum]|uniref:Thioesterase n=1 Tax=Mycolicibacterium insubricum TaxID=444597 RepID=A0A1X0DD97_9MYCO|nr:acyl-CoA thioesterase domain-containing protein [Mycolicibacterium insubricum]MCB0929182.1 thioesterase family protein [Mycobacterium sp.]MCV7081193.1 thioesterase family protein [Mycolicibacterium insubricum]ORA70374.1 thioesterase [Mycolicibacterium insubricum]BBZ67223.1 thioesterase [Mycolicibacterium insubricum]
MAGRRDKIFYFTADGDAFAPTGFARSHWGPDHLNGPAIVGLAARELERRHGSPDFRPARLTVDLFRAARERPTTVRTALVRDGHRVRNATCEVIQDDTVVAAATLVLFRHSVSPPGQLWSAEQRFDPPVAPVFSPDSLRPYTNSADAGWTDTVSAHQNASRKAFFNHSIDVVGGHRNTAFVNAAVLAEATSLVTNMGTAGVGFINGDLTVALARMPVDDWIGVQADSHVDADGIAVGTATLYDRAGAFGSGMVTAIANPAAQIDFTRSEFEGFRI